MEIAPVQQDSQSKNPGGFSHRTAQSSPSLALDVLRIALLILAIVVAAGFTLILLPKTTIDNAAQRLQTRSGPAKQEQIALLYLGDEIKDQSFHIRGVIRNITTQPIEKLDAAIRLYSADGSLAETDFVRMNKETIAPDETTEFSLVYPNYNSQFGSYSVDFKFRLGDFVFYRDMRTARGLK
jgi:hypothetical protein